MLALSLSMVGCGGSGGPEKVKVVPASGKLTLDGKPFGDLSLTLLPKGGEEGRRTVSGTVDSAGNIALTTYKVGDGAPAGSYTVVVSQGGVGKLLRIYQDKSRSGLSVTIPEKSGGTYEFTLALKSGKGPLIQSMAPGGIKGAAPYSTKTPTAK